MEINYNDFVMVRITEKRIKYVSNFNDESSDNLYKATHYRWRANLDKIKYKKFVLSVIGTEIVNVYEVIKWQNAKDRYGENGKGRVEFEGKQADEEIRNLFIGKKFPTVYQNPVQYLSETTQIN